MLLHKFTVILHIFEMIVKILKIQVIQPDPGETLSHLVLRCKHLTLDRCDQTQVVGHGPGRGCGSQGWEKTQSW